MIPGSARNWSSCRITNNRNQSSVKTSSRLNLPFWLSAACLTTILPAAMLMFSAQTSLADSATWLVSPMNGDWENPCNWTGGSMACGYFSAAAPPNGPSDTATFTSSSITAVLVDDVEVNGIVFSGSAFTISNAEAAFLLDISGVGITNNSGVPQNFVANNG